MRIIAILVMLFAAIWSGLWFYGRNSLQTALQQEVAKVEGAGGKIDVKSLQISGFPLSYRGAVETLDIVMPVVAENTLTPNPGPQRLSWTGGATTASVSALSPRTLKFSFPPRQRMILAPLETPDIANVDIVIGSEGMGGSVTRSGDAVKTSLAAATLRIIATLAATPDLDAMEVAFSGTDFTANVDAAGETLEDGPVVTSFSVKNFVKGAAVLAENSFAGWLESEARAGRLTGSSSVDTEWAEVKSDLEDVSVQLVAPIFLQLTAGRGETYARFPHGVGIGARAAEARLDMRDIVLDESVWERFDRSGIALARNLDQITFGLRGTLRDGAALPDVVRSREPLALLEQVQIKDLRIIGLGLEIVGEGRASTASGELLASAVVEVAGIDSFIERAVRGGLIPPQQAVIARLMINGAAREGRTPDHKRFEIEIVDGLTRVNGTAFGLAPKL